jgi:ribosomal protein L15
MLNAFKKNTHVDAQSLVKAHIVEKDALYRGVKLLGRGSISVALNVSLPVSAKAREKIQQAGGTLITA